MSKYSLYPEQIKDADTVEEMRVEIFRLRQYDPLVRNVMDRADYTGLSGEDRYTILAYYALKELNHTKKLFLEQAELNSHHKIFKV